MGGAQFFGEKNNGFDVLYHNMKHGQISSKELTDFIRERATIEEVYARSMTKLAKSAGNFSQLGTFAPVWDVFKTSTEKLASCHLELVRKLQELIKDVQKYVDDQAKVHKKTKEEVASTNGAVQTIQTTGVALQKSKENYNAKTVDQERLRKEGATQREVDKAGVKAKKATEAYKGLVEKYATAKSEFEQKMAETAQVWVCVIWLFRALSSTTVECGCVHTEFLGNMENTSVESLIQKLAESKGTGKERPGPIEFEECNTAIATEGKSHTHSNSFYSSSDSEDEDEPRKFRVEIKPVAPNNGTHQSRATIDELKASIGNISLSPPTTVRQFLDYIYLEFFTLAIYSTLYGVNVLYPLLLVKFPGLCGLSNQVRPFSPPKTLSNASLSLAAPLARAESSSSLSSTASLSASNTPTVGTSRGPSPVTLASQDALPIAVAFTESVNAYFKGADPTKCIVKITGDMTLSFPMGIIKVFTSNPSPAVLTFKLKSTSKLEQILPNQTLLFSDPSQSDTNTKDFWFNMQALTSYLRKASEQNPAASYYNVDILKYQVSSNGIQSTPLNLAVYWKCTPTTTDLRLDYRYNPESMLYPGPLSNVQVLVPVDGEVINMQSLPNAVWNSELNKSLWKLSDISEKSDNEGSGSLRAKFELSDGPSTPTTLAVQFMSEGSTLSGVDMELLGAGYRLSLNKKRFATGRYMADC
uniref:F-BAR domain only protein 2 n=1 Tax=Oncorhynchus tshawytscha TaxID=74940 RepID=A0A8C8M0R1_ONCTS